MLGHCSTLSVQSLSLQHTFHELELHYTFLQDKSIRNQAFERSTYQRDKVLNFCFHDIRGTCNSSVDEGTMGQNGSSIRPHDEAMEEINRIRAQLRQLEEDYRFARFDKSGNSKNLVTNLQQRFSNLRRWGSQESESDNILLEASRAVISEAGATPLMNVVDKIQALHGEMEKISDFLAQELRHSFYEIFQEELDQCHRESQLIVGEELSRFLVKVSEIDHLNQFLIKNVIQIFIVSFCETQWRPYFDKRYPDPGKHSCLRIGSKFTYPFSPATDRIQRRQSRNLGDFKRQFLNQLTNLFKIAAWSIPASKSRSAFEDSLAPFFKAMEKTKEALENLPKFTKVHLSIVGPDNDLSDSEICVVDTNIATDSQRTPDEKLLQEFSQGHIIGTFGIGVYCSTLEDRDVPRFRNLLRKKVIVSSAIVDQILPPTSPQLLLPPSGIVPSANLNQASSPDPAHSQPVPLSDFEANAIRYNRQDGRDP